MQSASNNLTAKPPLRTNAYVKGLAGLILLFLLPLEGMVQSALTATGADLVYGLQDILGSTSGYHFFEVIRYLGSDWVLLMLSPVLFHINGPRLAVKVVLVLSIGLYCNSLLNMIYCEPRPFWVLAKITGEVCPEGYANPSEQLTMFTVAYFYTAIHLLDGAKFNYKFGVYGFGVLLALLLSFGELYLGVLFLHQTITSLCFSFMYLTICITIDFLLTTLVFKSACNYNTNRINTVYWFVVTMVLMLAAVSIYDLITLQYMIDIRWVKNAIEDCDIEFDVGSDYSFFVSATVFYSYGLMLGSMHSSKILRPNWWHSPLWMRVLRALCACGLTVGWYFLFSKSHSDLIPSSDTTTGYCFHFVILYFISAYSVSMLVAWGAKRAHLISDPNLEPVSASEMELLNSSTLVSP